MEHEISRDVVWSIEYSGSKGVNLYSIAYPNQSGFGNYALGDPCSSDGSDCTSPPNPNYSFAVGYRGNESFSIYHGLNHRLLFAQLPQLGRGSVAELHLVARHRQLEHSLRGGPGQPVRKLQHHHQQRRLRLRFARSVSSQPGSGQCGSSISASG